MAGELEDVLRDFMASLDRMDFDALKAAITDDAAGVDEISRRWMRSAEDISAYFAQLEGAVTDVRSELRDVRESVWDGAGVVTFWLEQEYTLEGEPQHISAPTSAVLRREGGGWKIALFHSIPLPEAEGS